MTHERAPLALPLKMSLPKFIIAVKEGNTQKDIVLILDSSKFASMSGHVNYRIFNALKKEVRVKSIIETAFQWWSS